MLFLIFGIAEVHIFLAVVPLLSFFFSGVLLVTLVSDLFISFLQDFYLHPSASCSICIQENSGVVAIFATCIPGRRSLGLYLLGEFLLFWPRIARFF